MRKIKDLSFSTKRLFVLLKKGNINKFNKTRPENWDLTNIDFRGADFGGANFRGANFRGADFGGADFGGVYFRGADFRSANFGCADFRSANFGCANFGGAYFGGVYFRGADFRSANFGGANLRGANFGGADFGGVYFRGADFRSANFGCANFRGANFRGTYFGGANFRGADFGGVYFRDTYFGGAIDYKLKKKFISNKILMDKMFQSTKKYWICYKSFNENRNAPKKWEIAPGKLIKSRIDTDRWGDCGYGINVGTLEWCLNNCTNKIYKLFIPKSAEICVPYWTDGKVRVSKAKIISEIIRG